MDLAARLGRLPIFPLPSVQLFPHAILPLHIFEPRYRELLHDAMASDRRFAIAVLTDDYDPSEDGPGRRPAIRPVCGVGEVIAHEPLPDGRSNILLHGLARVRILEELPPAHEYRLVRAVPLVDRYPAGVDLGPTQHALIALSDQLAERLPEGGDTLRALVRSQPDPAALSDVLAATLVTDPEERQALLENLDVNMRMEAVARAIAEALSRFSDLRGPAN
jgi:Lon protease-like protein